MEGQISPEEEGLDQPKDQLAEPSSPSTNQKLPPTTDGDAATENKKPKVASKKQLKDELQLEKDKNKDLQENLDKLNDAFNALKAENEQLKEATEAKEEQHQGISYQSLQHELHKTADEKKALDNECRDLRAKLHHQIQRTR
ncbi:uncharacterized protein V6R79_012190 [Siganus canaliculatus]